MSKKDDEDGQIIVPPMSGPHMPHRGDPQKEQILQLLQNLMMAKAIIDDSLSFLSDLADADEHFKKIQ